MCVGGRVERMCVWVGGLRGCVCGWEGERMCVCVWVGGLRGCVCGWEG